MTLEWFANPQPQSGLPDEIPPLAAAAVPTGAQTDGAIAQVSDALNTTLTRRQGIRGKGKRARGSGQPWTSSICDEVRTTPDTDSSPSPDPDPLTLT